MDNTQLEKAIKDWGFAMDITLENDRILVANSGFITDDPTQVKAGKHSGALNGFFFSYKRKANLNDLTKVIQSISKN